MDGKTLARLGAVVFVAVAVTATAIEMTRKDEKRNAEILSHIPANRWGDTADLMGTTIFLASRASDYVNGATIIVDGGYLMR